MKKLLSLLALTGITATASSNVVSCGESAAVAPTIGDFNIKNLKALKLSGTDASGIGFYNAIRAQIAAQSTIKSLTEDSLTADDIKADPNLGITL